VTNTQNPKACMQEKQLKCCVVQPLVKSEIQSHA
jgi:hypothetical protein